ncbi:MAG: glycoside hydrolase [Acidobacteria bacterium]|nr:MAG: glycoside hydrolase [Acidobacteriota bacterium]
MPVLRVIILWHQHQPFYKDLVSGEYRLPWVRLHALKDYFGMVKLLDEFPNVHQTFNLVPSLITQIQDYVSGTAQDPFLQVAAKPAKDLTPEERRFALQYLFQANPVHMIGRYPRYRELWERFRGSGSSPEPAEKYFQAQDFTDLQVLSQIAWFDEFFLQDPEVAALIQKGRNYSLDDQRFVILHQRELLAKVLPAHAEAAQRGFIEISTSPFYHPILPLICDTNMGAVSTPGLPLPPQEAATHLMRSIKQSAQPALDQGKDAVLSIILDGENAWEYYPQSGREFLRRFYDALQREPGVEAVTVSEAIQRHKDFGQLSSLVPGSWIHANFNVWIGAPEDNRAWDYLHHARNFYDQTSAGATEPQRKLAFEEILISEGSDWNWWYGPEHHSANDRDFDELYRKHLSNVYQALGARPPDYLAQPIMAGMARPAFLHQSAYIHPRITGDMVRYFEWMGAAVYTADHRSGSMHGKQFLLDSVYAGIDERNVYGRLDFADGKVPDIDFELVVNLESWVADSPENDGSRHRRALRLDVTVQKGQIHDWKVTADENQLLATSQESSSVATLALGKNFEFKLPLDWLQAENATKLRLRFSLWRQGLPVDALPLEGWIELQLVSEEELAAMA